MEWGSVIPFTVMNKYKENIIYKRDTNFDLTFNV